MLVCFVEVYKKMKTSAEPHISRVYNLEQSEVILMLIMSDYDMFLF